MDLRIIWDNPNHVSPLKRFYTESGLSTHLHSTTHNDIDNDTVSVSRLEDVSAVLYNPVPKCGSSSVKNIIKELSKKNRFGLEFSGNYSGYRADKTEQVSEAANIPYRIKPKAS